MQTISLIGLFTNDYALKLQYCILDIFNTVGYIFKTNFTCLIFFNAATRTLKIVDVSPAGVAQWLSASLRNKGSRFDSQSRAHAWVVGQVPSEGRSRGNYTLMSLSLSSSLPLSKK